jgi:hypothetical protein
MKPVTLPITEPSPCVFFAGQVGFGVCFVLPIAFAF